MLNPVFSVNHMRNMLPLFYDLGHKVCFVARKVNRVLSLIRSQFRDAITARVSGGPQELDMLGWLGRVALELIGQGTLGYSFDPLLRDKPDSYGQALKALGCVPLSRNRKHSLFVRYWIPLVRSLTAWFSCDAFSRCLKVSHTG